MEKQNQSPSSAIHRIVDRLKFYLFLLLFLFGTEAFGANPEIFLREWSTIDVTGLFSSDWPDFRYEFFLQSRNIETRINASTGYLFTPSISAWTGFTWISPNDGSPQIFRPWQQVIWEMLDKNPIISMQTQTRVEQLKQESQPEWLWRVRERVSVAFPAILPNNLTLIIYDEVFFNVNKPVWITTDVVDRNEAFVGVATKKWRNTFIRVGYINQYVFSKPVNTMAHVISLSLIVEPP